jgi:hypothetical protein
MNDDKHIVCLARAFTEGEERLSQTSGEAQRQHPRKRARYGKRDACCGLPNAFASSSVCQISAMNFPACAEFLQVSSVTNGDGRLTLVHVCQ